MGSSSLDKKDSIELILYAQGVEKHSYRMGLSRVFFRAGTLTTLDRVVEENIHGTMVQFQVRIILYRGWGELYRGWGELYRGCGELYRGWDNI